MFTRSMHHGTMQPLIEQEMVSILLHGIKIMNNRSGRFHLGCLFFKSNTDGYIMMIIIWNGFNDTLAKTFPPYTKKIINII